MLRKRLGMDIQKLRLWASTKLLDAAEWLPKCPKISRLEYLQGIRARQRKRAKESLVERTIPDGVDISLSQITLILPFEYESFDQIYKGLRRYFPKNGDVGNFVSKMERSQDSLYAVNWYNLGYICKPGKNYFPLGVDDDQLPNEIEFIHLSFERILPSLACVVLEIKLSDIVTKEILQLQNKERLQATIFKSFWPTKKFAQLYSVNPRDGSATLAIGQRKNIFRKRLEKWLFQKFHWDDQTLESRFYVDTYELNGAPEKKALIPQWARNQSSWLGDFGIDVYGSDTLWNKKTIYSNPHRNDAEGSLSKILVVLNPGHENNSSFEMEETIRAVAASLTIFATVSKHQDKIEELRAKGLNTLHKSKGLSLNGHESIQSLKKEVVMLSRLENELEQTKGWVRSSISGIKKFRLLRSGEKIVLEDITLANAKVAISKLQKIVSTIDDGLSNYLSIQNLYITYKLQNRMFWLTVVVTIATIAGVLLQWDDLSVLINKVLGQSLR